MSNQTHDNETLEQPRRGFRFRLVHLFYATAVVASSLSIFGPGGWVLAAIVIGFWSYVFFSNNRIHAFGRACLLLFCVSGCLLFLLPAVAATREAARRSQCVNNLKQIAIALHNYHDTYKTLPPAYIADKNGKPIHSWRVIILPWIEQQALYDRYKFDEPWDGPNNSKLHKALRGYQCPNDRGSQSSYYVVVGDQTAWPGEQARSWSQITDGLANSILVVEAEGRGRHWMEPVDIPIEEALRLFVSPETDKGHRREDYFYEYWNGRNVALGDGSVHFIYYGRSLDSIYNWLVVNDGQKPASFYQHDDAEESYKYVKWDNWLRLAIFVVLVLLPLPWVFLSPRRFDPKASDIRIDEYRKGSQA